MAARAQSGGAGLSVQTLLIAALASGGAAVIVSNLWESGTVMAAAITPVIVSLLREAVLPKAIERPARAVASVRTARRTAGFSAGGATTGAETRPGETAVTAANQPTATERLGAGEPGLDDLDPRTDRLDTQGASLEDTTALDRDAQPPLSFPGGRTPRVTGPDGGHVSGGPLGTPAPSGRRVYGRRRGPRVRLAVITGLLAFMIAAVVLTVPELIAGGSVGGSDGRTTLFSAGDGADSRQGEGAEDRVTDGGEDGGSGPSDGEDGADPEPSDGADGGDSDSSPEGGRGDTDPSPGADRGSQRGEPGRKQPERSPQRNGGGAGASQRGAASRGAPSQGAPAPSSPSGGGEAAE